MAKIPFNAKYRPQIESGKYKVKTRNGKPVRIICWDMDSYNPIVALISNYPNYDGSLSEHIFSYDVDGHYTTVCPYDEDLFIITPEEELTEFEAALMEFVNAREPKNPMTSEGAKNNGSILLNIAREQFIKDGYVIEKKAFHDAVEKVDPEVMEEVSEALKELPTDEEIKSLLRTEYEKGRADVLKEIEQDLESSYAFKRGVKYGKEEALKDLPKWKKICRGNNYSSETEFTINGRYLEMNDTLNDVYEAPLSALEKLPRFKED